MPIKFESETGLNLGQFPEPQVQTEGPSGGELLKAAFRRENSVGSKVAQADDKARAAALRAEEAAGGVTLGESYDKDLTQVSADEYFGMDDARNPRSVVKNEFNPFMAALDSGYSEDEIDALIHSNPQNEQDFQEFDVGLRRQREDAQTLDEGGVTGIMAQMAAGTIDPTIFLGGSAAIKGAKGISLGARLVKTGKAAKGAATIAKGAGVAALAGVEGTLAQEGVLQATQTGRTIEESAMNLAGAAIAAPVLIGGMTAVAHMWGGKIGRYAPTLEKRGITLEELGNKYADDIEDVSGLEAIQKNMDDVVNNTSFGDLSAAAVDVPDFEADSLKPSFGVAKITKNLTPSLRTLQSPSAKVREISQNLFENSMLMNKITGGRYAQQIAAERMIKGVMQDAEAAIGSLRKSYSAYLKENGATGFKRVTGALGREEGILQFDQFKQEVTKAMRRNDDHADLIIREAALNARKFYDQILERGKNAGVFDENLTSVRKTDASGDPIETYVNRLYNVDKIKREEGNWRQIIRPHIEKAVRATVNEAYQVHKGKLDRLDGQITKLERDNAAFRDGLANQSNKGAGVNVGAIERMSDVDLAYAKQRLEELTDKNFVDTRTLSDIDPKAAAESRYAELLDEYPDPELAPEDIRAVIDQYKLGSLMQDAMVALKKPPKAPSSLVDFLQRRGGLQDVKGELKAIGIDNRARVGFINNNTMTKANRKRGLQLDEATKYAVEEGYLPEGSQISDLLESLDMHFKNDRPTYLAEDFETLREIDEINDTREILSQFGVSNPRQFIRDVYEAAKLERKGAKADVKAAQARQKMTKEIGDQVRSDVQKNVMPRLSELYDYRKYYKQKAESQMKINEKRLAELQERAKKLDDDFQYKLKYDYDVGNNMDGYIDEAVQSVTDKVLARKGEKISSKIPIMERGPLKGRTFNISDTVIEGYLDNDIENLLASYARSAGADIELAHKFGTLDVEDQAKLITDDYNDMRDKIIADEKIPAAEKEKQLKNLDTFLQRDLRDIRSGWDIMRGTYKQDTTDPDKYFTRGASALRTINMMRMLGGVVMSSLTDLAMPVFVHGMGRYYGEFMPSLISNLKGIKLQVKDARFLRIAMEHENASWLSSYAELGDPHANRTMVERLIQNAGRNFGKISGIVYWNNLGQKIASSISQTRILKAIEAGQTGKLAKEEAEYLAFLGIDKNAQASIYKQYKDTRGIYGADESVDVKIAGVDRWTDSEAVRTYRAALGKDVDRQILQVGKGELPLFMNTELGKTITQFKSFSAAAHSKLLISGLQRRDAGAITGFAHLIAMGMLVDYAKSVESGREISDNPADWIINGVDRSGALTLFFEIANTADKMNVGPRSLLGLSESSRFASRSAVDTLLGPTAGMLGDTAQVVGAMAGNSPTSSADVHKLRRLMIGNNVTYLRPFFDKLEEAYGGE